MSTDWIKMRVDLRTHPKVVRMASALRADRLRVIGGLFAVWSIFDAHSVDGVLEGYTFHAIDDDLGWKGFAEAMSAVEWLVDHGGAGLGTPRFEEHNGQSAKRRAMENERKRADRKADKLETKDGQVSASDADKKRTREEKRREEKRQPSVVARGARLPTDWEPGERGLAYAASKGLTNGIAQAELEKFRDHWAAKPGKDGTSLDWQAKWRTWVRNSLEFRARAGKPQDLDDIFRRGQA